MAQTRVNMKYRHFSVHYSPSNGPSIVAQALFMPLQPHHDYCTVLCCAVLYCTARQVNLLPPASLLTTFCTVLLEYSTVQYSTVRTVYTTTVASSLDKVLVLTFTYCTN